MKIRITLPKWLNKKKTSKKGIKNLVQEKYQGQQESHGWGIGSMIGFFVVILIGTSLIEPMMDAVNSTSNLSGISKTLLDSVPLLFGLAIATSAISMVYYQLRKSGVIV